MHIYVQEGKKVDGKIQLTDNYKYRGESGKHDDPKSFKKRLEQKGLKVHLSRKFLGLKIDKNFKKIEG